MGGATSRFAETDWDVAVLQTEADIKTSMIMDDGLAPTKHHTILTLQKTSSLVNQRAFEIRDFDTGNVLYFSKPIEGTSKWFDFFNGDTGEKVFCIQTTDNHHDHWMIYRYNKANWEGQACEKESHRTASSPKQAQEEKEHNVCGDTLYRTARMDISWNKNHGNVYKYVPVKFFDDEDAEGVLSTTRSLLQVEEIKSVTAQYQSFVPLSENPAINVLMKHPPLCAYWVWENTKNRYQMKMHLAAGADVELNCIAAIVSHMVYVESKTNAEDRMR